jgi:hypothetical protein
MRRNETKKMRSRSDHRSLNNVAAIDSMKYSVPALLFALTLASGCGLLEVKSKKSAPAELPPAAAVEAEFRDRWVAQRTHELLAAGNVKTEDDAKAMAVAEFAKQFPFIRRPVAKGDS